jgi:hypothetical protein
MMARRLRSGLIAASIALAMPAKAATPLDALIRPVADASACFSRVYNAAHLRQHPRQTTTAMTIWLRYEPMQGGAPGLALDLGIAIHRRGDPLPYFAQGDCVWDARANRNTSDQRMVKSLNKDEAAVCMMSAQPDVFEATSAEEGGFLLLDRGKDRDTLMVYLDDGLTMVKRATRGSHEHVRFGTDDRVFLLRRTDIKNCAAVENAVTEPEPGVAPRQR